MTLKDRVIKAMSHKECDINELAQAAKVKAPSAHGWINGSSHSMKAGPAIRAAKFLGVNALWLAEGEGEMLSADIKPLPKQLDSRISKVIQIMQATDDEGRIRALMAVEFALKDHKPAKANHAS